MKTRLTIIKTMITLISAFALAAVMMQMSSCGGTGGKKELPVK
jgi:hypothetical protein